MQLSIVEVDAAHRLSWVRIHVERVIGLIQQKYAQDTRVNTTY